MSEVSPGQRNKLAALFKFTCGADNYRIAARKHVGDHKVLSAELGLGALCFVANAHSTYSPTSGRRPCTPLRVMPST